MRCDERSGAGLSEDDHRNARLDAELAGLREMGLPNAEVAEHLSPDLQPLFWRRELDIFFAKELGE